MLVSSTAVPASWHVPTQTWVLQVTPWHGLLMQSRDSVRQGGTAAGGVWSPGLPHTSPECTDTMEYSAAGSRPPTVTCRHDQALGPGCDCVAGLLVDDRAQACLPQHHHKCGSTVLCWDVRTTLMPPMRRAFGSAVILWDLGHSAVCG